MSFYENICSKIRLLVDRVVRKNLTEGILLSGGLDTSILALIASKYRKMTAFTVAFRNAVAPDIEFAKLIAARFNMEHRINIFGEDEMFPAIRDVIKILKVFDPMLVRNNTAILIGLQLAKENGINSVMTGDGLDELFAGYSWLFNLSEQELNFRLAKMWESMEFVSIPLAHSLGMEAKNPFLDSEFKDYAMSLDSKLKIKRERGSIWGKWIVRKSFEKLLPDKIVWRVKTPIEVGSGTTVFPKFFEHKISNEYFEKKSKYYLTNDQVSIRDKEHLFYFEDFRSTFGSPARSFANAKGRLCPECQARIDDRNDFCRICGAYPI